MELNLGNWRKTEEISWYFQVGEVMKEVNAFFFFICVLSNDLF